MKNCEVDVDQSKLFIIYDWADEAVKISTHEKRNALAKIGADFLMGDDIDNYKLIEINLKEVGDND